MQSLAAIADNNLKSILNNLDYLTEEARKKTVELVKKLTIQSYPHAAKAEKYTEFSKDRTYFIWDKGCKDAGLPGLFDKEAYEDLLSKYINQELTDAELYHASKNGPRKNGDLF